MPSPFRRWGEASQNKPCFKRSTVHSLKEADFVVVALLVLLFVTVILLTFFLHKKIAAGLCKCFFPANSWSCDCVIVPASGSIFFLFFFLDGGKQRRANEELNSANASHKPPRLFFVVHGLISASVSHSPCTLQPNQIVLKKIFWLKTIQSHRTIY